MKEMCVRGFHVYRAVWDAAVGEELECKRERGNRVDRYAVAVDTIVGHVLEGTIADSGAFRVWELFSRHLFEIPK